VIASAAVVCGWSYFIFTGNILTLWPMFGVANQLLAVVALAVGTSVIVNEGRSRYAWVTIVPLAFVGTTTVTGGFLSITNIFWPLTRSNVPGEPFKGVLNSALTAVMMGCVLVVLAEAVPSWVRHWKEGRRATLERVALPGEVFV